MKGRYLRYYTILLSISYGVLIFLLFGFVQLSTVSSNIKVEAAVETVGVVEVEEPSVEPIEELDVREEVAIITEEKPDSLIPSDVAPEPEPNIQKIDYSFDVFEPSNYTKDDLTRMLANRSGFIPHVDSFIKAEETYGVNAVYLMATMGLESGWGKYRANTNNIAGWKNSTYTGYRSFKSIDDCIMTVARGLKTGYEPLGTSLVKVTSRYCPTEGYTNKIIGIMKELQRGY